MKKIILSLALVFLSMNAFAFTVTTEKVIDSDSFRSGPVKFMTDKNNLGRAWLEVEVDTDDIDEIWTYVEKVKVEGLMFDNIQNKVLFSNGDKTVTCANVKVKETRNIFTGKTRIRHKVMPTENCLIKTELEERDVVIDTGFDLQTRKVVVLLVKLEAL